MTGRALISERTASELATVAGFFGIDMEWNRHIFRHAAQVDSKAFESVIRALAQAVEQDCRFGVAARIRENIAREKTKK